MRVRRNVFRGSIALIACWLGASFAVLHGLRSRRQDVFEERVPNELAGQVVSTRIATRDGEEIGAWFLPESREDAPSVLELHGLGGTRRQRLGAARIVRERGAAVLLVTLRAHGDSSGNREDFGWSARADVLAAVDWLEARRPGRPIWIHGTSLGAAAAVFAAQELGERVRGYALECLYADLSIAARNRCSQHLPVLLDDVAYAGLRLAAVVAWPDFSSIAPRDAIATIPPSSSILLLAGGADVLATREETLALFSRVSDRAHLGVVPGAEHDRLLNADPASYRAAVLDWLDGT